MDSKCISCCSDRRWLKLRASGIQCDAFKHENIIAQRSLVLRRRRGVSSSSGSIMFVIFHEKCKSTHRLVFYLRFVGFLLPQQTLQHDFNTPPVLIRCLKNFIKRMRNCNIRVARAPFMAFSLLCIMAVPLGSQAKTDFYSLSFLLFPT